MGKEKNIPIGRTIRTKDENLPSKNSKVQNKKEHRWVAVIDKNTHEELAVVRLTTKKQKNTSLLIGYRCGNKKDTFFKHFVETNDNKGNPIKVDGRKFIENDKKNDLTGTQIKQIKKRVLEHSQQASDNKNKIRILKKGSLKNKK